MTYLDGGIGRLLDHLAETLDQTLIVVTTDIGQALGEHGVVGMPDMHEENIHLPLVMRLPGGDAAGRHVPALTQAVDLAPTLADVFEVPLPDAQGFTLLPLIYGDVDKVRDFAWPGCRTRRVCVPPNGRWCSRGWKAASRRRSCSSSRKTAAK